MLLQLEAEKVPMSPDSDGAIRVGGTRVTLDTVLDAYGNGSTPEGIVGQYPALTLADVYTAIGYYLRHRAAVDGYLAERRPRADQVRQENELRHDPAGVRARLLARRPTGFIPRPRRGPSY